MASTGIIIVSHSEKLAEGVAELISEMGSDEVVVKAAGGTGDGRLGTNSLRIQRTIESMADRDHILVYCDMGSSIISTDTAIDMLEEDEEMEDVRERVRIVDCPLVEGAFAGVVQASVDGDVAKIIRASERARELHKC